MLSYRVFAPPKLDSLYLLPALIDLLIQSLRCLFVRPHQLHLLHLVFEQYSRLIDYEHLLLFFLPLVVEQFAQFVFLFLQITERHSLGIEDPLNCLDLVNQFVVLVYILLRFHLLLLQLLRDFYHLLPYRVSAVYMVPQFVELCPEKLDLAPILSVLIHQSIVVHC